MTALAEILKQRIAISGPMNVADYMAQCLWHPDHGYYSTRDPLGVAGDFTTAPEISQMFGELIGLALAQSWLDQGKPAPFALAELGPGRGTLMADILRVTSAVPGFTEAAQVHLVETSPALQTKQRVLLQGIQSANMVWHGSLRLLPDMPLFLIANEFFDALPIHQFLRADNGWRERMVAVQDNELVFANSEPSPLPELAHRLIDTKPGDLVEICSLAPGMINEITRRIHGFGGVAIIIDYGDWRSLGDTLQALANHKPIAPLLTPGEADLTAHVDFEHLARAAVDRVSFTRLTPQGVYLERLGITARAHALSSRLREEALENHILAHRRLTHPSEMGTLFKAMAFYRSDMPIPPGFEP